MHIKKVTIVNRTAARRALLHHILIFRRKITCDIERMMSRKIDR